MAEIVGVVVGVASFSVQIADGVKKLAEFCQAVKDAPADLQITVHELENLAKIYLAIEQQMNVETNPATLPSRMLLDQMLQSCRRSQQSLGDLINNIVAEINKQPTRGSIRAVLKKGTITRLQQNVQNAKDTLSLSYLVYCSTLGIEETRLSRAEAHILSPIPSQMSAMQSQISALSSQVSSMTPKLDVLVTHSTTLVTSTVSTTNRNWHLDGNSRRQRKLKNKVVYKLQLPSWLHSRAYELVYTHSTNIWTTQFRVYNTVPADSPFLLACSSGDYEAVREIIAVDPAHVFDQNERGETALHYAVREVTKSSVVEVVKLLIEKGADVSRQSSDFVWHRTPFEDLLDSGLALRSWLPQSLPNHDMVWELSNALSHVDCLVIEEELYPDDPYRLIKLENFCHIPTAVEVAQSMMSPPWLTRPLKERVFSLANGIFHLRLRSRHRTRQEFEVILGSKLSTDVWEIDRSTGQGFTLHVMNDIGAAVRLGTIEEIEEWRNVLQQVISSGISLTNQSYTMAVRLRRFKNSSPDTSGPHSPGERQGMSKINACSTSVFVNRDFSIWRRSFRSLAWI
ncbi:hypothetical protein VTO58DRAFT_102004 [Aureobasidium pullulans]